MKRRATIPHTGLACRRTILLSFIPGYDATFRSAESRHFQNVVQERLNLEAATGQHFVVLRQNLQTAEQEYGATICQEARQFTAAIRAEYEEELQHHMTSNAQAQSLLAAERRHHNKALEEQANRWQTALDLVTEGTDEMHDESQRRNETQEQHAETL